MTITIDDILRFIEGLSSDELARFSSEVQRRLDLPPVPALHAMDATMGTEPIVGGYDDYSVMLVSVGADRIAVIKAVREMTQLGLKEAKALIESTPTRFRDGLTRSEANEIADRLQKAGAQVEVR